jgi:hypothetical protein
MTGRFGPLTAFEGALAVPLGAGFGTFITSSTTRGAADPSAVDPGTATAKCAHSGSTLGTYSLKYLGILQSNWGTRVLGCCIMLRGYTDAGGCALQVRAPPYTGAMLARQRYGYTIRKRCRVHHKEVRDGKRYKRFRVPNQQLAAKWNARVELVRACSTRPRVSE